MTSSNKRRIEEAEIDVDDIGPINNEVGDGENIIEEHDPVVGDIPQMIAGNDVEELRTKLRRLLLSNPHIKMTDLANLDNTKVVDTMTEQELKLLELQIKNSIGSVVDKKVSKGLISALSRILPYVDAESLIADLNNDELFQSCWNTFLGLHLMHIPEELKLAVMYGNHVFNNVTLRQNSKKVKENAAIEPSIQNVNMREV